MGTADASYRGCSERQDRAPQAQDMEHHTGKIRNTFLCMRSTNIHMYSTLSARSHQGFLCLS